MYIFQIILSERILTLILERQCIYVCVLFINVHFRTAILNLYVIFSLDQQNLFSLHSIYSVYIGTQ